MQRLTKEQWSLVQCHFKTEKFFIFHQRFCLNCNESLSESLGNKSLSPSVGFSLNFRYGENCFLFASDLLHRRSLYFTRFILNSFGFVLQKSFQENFMEKGGDFCWFGFNAPLQSFTKNIEKYGILKFASLRIVEWSPCEYRSINFNRWSDRISSTPMENEGIIMLAGWLIMSAQICWGVLCCEPKWYRTLDRGGSKWDVG